MKLGDRIRQLRLQSSFPDRRSFSFRSSISSEGLRKIENGSRVPERSTLDKLLETASCPRGTKATVISEWEKAQAQKVGSSVQSVQSAETLAETVVDEVEQYLEGNEWSLPDDWKDDLQTRLTKRLSNAILYRS